MINPRKALGLVSALFALLLLDLGCGGGGSNTPAPPVAPTIVTPPTDQTVLEGATASFSVTAGGTAPLTYQWKKGGTDITSGTSSSYTTPATTLADSGTTYTVTVTNSVGTVTSSAATLTVRPNPVITTFTAAPTAITAGGSATLHFEFTGGTGTIDHGVNAVASGTDITVTPTATTTYTLSVDNGFGTTKTSTATVTVVPTPVKPVITAAANVTSGKAGLLASVPIQTNMSYLWTINGGTITAGGTSAQVTYTPGSVGTLTLNCTVSNSLNVTAVADAVIVNVFALPTAALVASTTNPELGATVTLTPTFSIGSGVIDQGIGPVSNGVGKPSAAITGATSFTLTVTHPQTNDTATAKVDITPQAVVVGAISPAAPIATTGAAVNFTSVGVTGALDKTLTWSATGGTINPSSGAWTAPSTAGTYTITATSNADNTKKATTTVKVVAAPDATITAPTTVAPSATGRTASVPTQVGATYAWSIAGNGSLTSATDGPSVTFSSTTAGSITLTCTVTNEAGMPATGNATVMVSADNQTPVFTTTPPATIHTQQLYSYSIGTSDPDGDAVTLSLVSAVPSYGGTNYTLTTQPTLAGNTLTWTPWEVESGYTITFTLRATDSRGATQDQVWSVVMNDTVYGSLMQGNAMWPPRQQHTVTQISGGKILIVGGNGLNTAVLYDPATKLYTQAGTMAVVRTEHMAVSYGGNVWVFGGYAGTNSATVERFNPSLNGGTGGFETCGPVKHSRVSFSTMPLGNGRVLLVGGYNAQTGVPVAEIEVYDMTANGGLGSATVVGSLSTPRWGHTALKSGTKLFIYGGGTSNDGGIPNTYATTTEVIDLTTFAVTSQTGLTTRRVYAQALSVPGKTIILGGLTGTDANYAQTLATSEVIDPATGAVTGAGPSLNYPRMGFARAGLFDGSVLVAGGGNVVLAGGAFTTSLGHDTIETWDANANGGAGAFVLMPVKFSTPRSRIERSTCVSNVTGEFMVFGGNGTDPVQDLDLNDVTVYSPITPTTNTFANAGNLVNATKGGRLAPIGDGQTLFVDQNNAQTQIFDLGTNTWTAGPTLQAAHEDGVVVEIPGNTVAIFSGATSWTDNPVVTTKVEWLWRDSAGSFETECPTTSVLNYGRVGLTATLLPGYRKALVVGGMAGTNISVPQIELYNVDANSGNGGSTVLGNLTTPVAYHKALYANGKVYLVGGVKDPGQPTMALPTRVQIVNPTTGAVTLGATMPNTTNWFGGQGIQLSDGRLLLAGSAVLGGALSPACYIFDPNANSGQGSFTATGSMNTTRTGASLSRLADGRILMTGGRTVWDGTQPGLTTAEIFDPATGTWTAVGQAMSATRVNHTSCPQKDGSVLIVGNAIDQQGPTAQGAFAERFK